MQPARTRAQSCSPSHLTVVHTFSLDIDGLDDRLWDSTPIDDDDAGSEKDNGYIAVGETFKDNASEKRQALIIRIKPDLSGYDWMEEVGGNGNDVAYAVEQASNGNVIVVGTVTTPNIESTLSANVWFAEYTVDGDLVGEREYGDSGNEDRFDIKEDVSTDPIQYVITGGTGKHHDGDLDEFGSIHNQGEYWLFTIDPTDDEDRYNILWQQIYDGDHTGGGYKDWAHSLFIDENGDYVIAGLCRSCGTDLTQMQAMLVKTHNDGTLVWKENFGDAVTLGNSRDQMAYNVIQVNSSPMAYLASGISHPGIGCATHNHDLYALKISGAGNNVWSSNCTSQLDEGKGFGGDSIEDGFSAIKISCTGKYLIAGSTGSPTGNDDVTCNNDGTSPYTSDVWLLELNASGVKQWDESLGGTRDDAAHSIQEVSDGSYVIAGEFGTVNHADLYLVDFTLVECEKLEEDGTEKNNELLSVYPNPSDGSVNISFNLPGALTQPATIEIQDQFGRIVSFFNAQIESEWLNEQIPTNQFNSGFYQVVVRIAELQCRAKLVIERN